MHSTPLDVHAVYSRREITDLEGRPEPANGDFKQGAEPACRPRASLARKGGAVQRVGCVPP